MKKASEYAQHGAECRALAAKATSAEHRDMLERMAETWESLAREREAKIARQRRIATLDTVNGHDTGK